MAVIYPHFLRSTLEVHENLQSHVPYPFFDPACIRYEALRSVWVDEIDLSSVTHKYGLTAYSYRKSFSAFKQYGTVGLIGLDSQQLIEELPTP